MCENRVRIRILNFIKSFILGSEDASRALKNVYVRQAAGEPVAPITIEAVKPPKPATDDDDDVLTLFGFGKCDIFKFISNFL